MTVLHPVMLTVSQAAELLNISRSTCYRLVRAGTIPVVWLGATPRIPREALIEMIAERAKGRVA